MDFIQGFLNIQSLISFIAGLIPGGFFIYKLASFIIRKEIRLFNNLKRTVYLINTDNKGSLQREKTLLNKNGLYKVHEDILNLSDFGILETVEKFSVFVIAYSVKFRQYQKIIDRAKRDSIPIIIVAKPGEIIYAHMLIFNSYPYFEMVNTSSRLLTMIFNLSIITPYEKR
jgi:hypothetical protein